MPTARRLRVTRDPGSLTGTPSVLQAIASRPWTSQAACAVPPYDDWRRVLNPAPGSRTPPRVAALLGICRRCPVREDCLRDEISEVETIGLEPTTPCLQSRCSTN